MSRSYKATGINLKAMPLGETDRLLTILTVEQGLVRAVAPGARKPKSSLGGRSGQFVVNHLLIIEGKQLDKLVQAETVQSFPGLSGHLAKLTASQYLAELVLCQALSGQPQAELFALFVEHLTRLESASGAGILACLSHGIFHLLALAGVAPEVQRCCVSQQAIVPDLVTPNWQVGFSAIAGGIVSLAALGQISAPSHRARTTPGRYAVKREASVRREEPSTTRVTAPELALLQRLGEPEILTSSPLPGWADQPTAYGSDLLWQRVERLLRHYAQYHFDRAIRSATLIDACFPAAGSSE